MTKNITIEKVFKNVRSEVERITEGSQSPVESNKLIGDFPRIDFLRESFDVSVGYSGHCEGIEDGIAAVSKGVDFVEKHFTTDQDLPGRDNKFAILPEQMKNLSQFRDHFLEMKIDLGKNLQECEMDTFQNYRGRWSKDG